MATTISNSGGPSSPTALSHVTIAVRDKVIEKFQDQPLREMNESLKMLLSKEQDEQKRLGILAARVYILRQRITALADPAPDMVVSGESPSLKDTDATDKFEHEAGDETNSEWTRLRILEDCEVNGVRFPKTVIIDVKSVDAQRLIDSGNAELMEERPEASGDDESPQTTADDNDDGTSAMQAELDASPADADDGAMEPAADAGNDATDDSVTKTDDEKEAVVEAAQKTETSDTEPEAETNNGDEAAEQTEDVLDAGEDADDSSEAVINAPSAAEVTAALAALSSDNETSDVTEAEANSADEAAAVAAELEAAAAAMAVPPSSSDSDDGDDDSKPSGWFEAQQNAEKAAKAETDDENEGGDPADEKS